MFLTGFDSKTLNTLYVDKNLKYHGLIQAFSRTNRILNEQKSQGNIVCFRNLKSATDDAIALFSNKDAKDIILMEPYEDYLEQFEQALDHLKSICPTVDSVNDLVDENAKLEFVIAFREMMRTKNVLDSFSDFKFSDVTITEQDYEDYKSKYLDIHDVIGKRDDIEKVSILEDVDFELELIHQDEINVAYILKLLAKLFDTGRDADDEEKETQKNNIITIINGQAQLRSKKELIEKFIDENLMKITDSDAIGDEFEKYWDEEKEKSFNEICEDENLHKEEVLKVVETYLYDQRPPLSADIAKTLKVKPKLLERKKIIPRVIEKLMEFIERFSDF
jgi:type I restriction enzyme R subunit